MAADEPITFVVPVNDDRVLEHNFLASPALQGCGKTEILLQRGFGSAAVAYNAAIDRAVSDLIAFVHQDIYLPPSWLKDVSRTVSYLDREAPDWGVLGCYGVTRENTHAGFVYSNGIGVIGARFERPVAVRTLDEIVLIIRRSSRLRFNPQVPHFHLYGAELCLQAAEGGRKCYALPAFCIHNTRYASLLPKEFYESYAVVKKLWRSRLPIRTSCISITEWDLEVRLRRLKALQFTLGLRTDRHRKDRVTDPGALYRDLVKRGFYNSLG